MLNHSSSSKRRDRGMTLIEMMVSLAIGMFIASALLLLFARSASQGKDLDRGGTQIENGRYATELLRDEIALAGFYGPVSTTATGTPTTYPLQDACATDPTVNFSPPTSLPTPIQGIAASTTLTCVSNRLAGTEAIAIRHVSVETQSMAALAANQYYLQDSFCNSDPKTYVLSKTAADFTLRNRACTAANDGRSWVQRIYYIASCNRCAGSGDNMPTLKRAELVGNTWEITALVEGVENMRFDYGIDADANGTPDSYVEVGSVTNWGDVMLAKVHLLTRSIDPATNLNLSDTAQSFKLGGTTVTTAADGYLRRAYTFSVRLVNPSGWRDS